MKTLLTITVAALVGLLLASGDAISMTNTLYQWSSQLLDVTSPFQNAAIEKERHRLQKELASKELALRGLAREIRSDTERKACLRDYSDARDSADRVGVEIFRNPC